MSEACYSHEGACAICAQQQIADALDRISTLLEQLLTVPTINLIPPKDSA